MEYVTIGFNKTEISSLPIKTIIVPKSTLFIASLYEKNIDEEPTIIVLNWNLALSFSQYNFFSDFEKKVSDFASFAPAFDDLSIDLRIIYGSGLKDEEKNEASKLLSVFNEYVDYKGSPDEYSIAHIKGYENNSNFFLYYYSSRGKITELSDAVDHNFKIPRNKKSIPQNYFLQA